MRAIGSCHLDKSGSGINLTGSAYGNKKIALGKGGFDLVFPTPLYPGESRQLELRLPDGKTGWVRYQPGSIPEHLPLDLQVEGPELLRLRPPPGLHRNEPFPHYRMDDLIGWLVDGSQV